MTGPDHYQEADEIITQGGRPSTAIQLTAGPAGTRLSGAWVGFNKDGGIQTGPWTLDLVSSDTGKKTMDQYNRPVEQDSA